MKEIKRLSEYEENEIKDLLFGRKVKKIDESTMELDNGLLLEIQANEG